MIRDAEMCWVGEFKMSTLENVKVENVIETI